MSENPLKSIASYSRYVAELIDCANIEHSTVAIWSESPYTGIAEGDIFFSDGFRLRLREELDFEAGLITAYGYEVYRLGERLFWYDDFPHPNEKTLASTFPHHKHVPPDIKHNRIPADQMNFSKPNLSMLLREIHDLIKRRFNT